MNNVSYPEEDTAVNDGDQLCYVGHLVCVCVCGPLCVCRPAESCCFIYACVFFEGQTEEAGD